jgi:hypothetical protein
LRPSSGRSAEHLPVGLRPGPDQRSLDKTISYTIVYAILIALPITVRTMYSRGEMTVAD